MAASFESGEKRPSTVEFPALEAIFHHFRVSAQGKRRLTVRGRCGRPTAAGCQGAAPELNRKPPPGMCPSGGPLFQWS